MHAFNLHVYRHRNMIHFFQKYNRKLIEMPAAPVMDIEYTLENTEGAIKNGQSRESDNKTKKKN